MLGDLLTYKPGTAKLEKFLAQQISEKLKELRTQMKIDETFSSLNQRIQQRLRKLRETKFIIDEN